MNSICRQLIEDGELEGNLKEQARAEVKFNAELGVLQRRFLQCIRQPHLIWANTEWTTEKAHNAAAKSIMKVREDDRVASAYFRPGQYWEIFALPLEGAAFDRGGAADFVVVVHGLVADRHADAQPRHGDHRTALRPPPARSAVA